MQRKKARYRHNVPELVGLVLEMCLGNRTRNRRNAEAWLQRISEKVEPQTAVKLVIVCELPGMQILWTQGNCQRAYMQRCGFYYVRNERPYTDATMVMFLESQLFWQAALNISNWSYEQAKQTQINKGSKK